MEWKDFATQGARAAQWAADYHAGLRDRPVRAQTRPGEIAGKIPDQPPDAAEDIEAILGDLDEIILPGMTHWQHPRFFAYFPANAAPVSVLAEYYVSTMAAQCMLWQTSPAATELETRVIDWMRQAVGLPDQFSGSIQDSASTATLCAVLTMREKALGWAGNREGLAGQKQVRIYASDQVHSSIDRAIWVAGIGEANLVRIPVTGAARAMDIDALRAAIAADRAAGHLPAGVIACVGGTSVGATDDLRAVLTLARDEGLYSHVDAAWAGAAMICPEFRDVWEGVEMADSVVLNPHKWLGAQFDCSTHFLADPADLVRTLAIQPEYLKTAGADGIINYSEWTVPLGRRFRALKLWFLIRAHGLDGLREMIRNHVHWSESLARRLADAPGIEIVTQPMLSLFSFRMAEGDEKTEALLHKINNDGRIYLTQTRVDGAYVIRFQAGAFTTTEADIDTAFEVITELAREV
ncbi:aspartate aminotransferase family protein [Ponticoccus sp. SC2-23]|uniref:pyridoxal phosphate-dependent decarboxylase family protein n=1 Tax=Alexandriicola marinus TaxID=2081710 RepID=UPI000FD9A941|nr:pyridoxal-dependent decarboxylase [Alexandriicola marinus]MBM1220864.1 aspartate aminotransferase family protein [Ponticoccus sp. SC6-9]MBM1225434.1 aspartate aminotransferase family protein [Ponticoccus sp. SC6-15]MBM1227617.1 aspartate aminotransferase family protein [Ponticoccus sp. SC6-38]MBM1234745.1 aspartate aminotransferase family protein [Ponticoccus sp. SC6-45]MBM1238119.1 aspartate aminotransferase family protein [Ponticoccus sp. SC6-49]MBM1244248.1 aspartate aminotransferase fa